MSEALVKSEAVDRLAEKVAEMLEPRLVAALEAKIANPETTGLVDAAAVADLLGIKRSTVYQHAHELGAVRIGDGDRPRLRFDPERAKAGASQIKRTNATTTPTRRATRPPRRSTAPLLPVRGRAA